MRNRSVTGKRPRVAGTGIGAVALLAGLLAAPTAALAAPSAGAPVAATAKAAACTPASGTLTWGVKESFRSYISGSIANGKWTVSDDMKYETPNFIWNKIAGAFDPKLESGRVNFTGAVDFTGHDGAMKLDIANPGIEFSDPETAYLMLSIGSTDKANAGGAAAANEVRAAKIDLTGKVASGGGALSIAQAPARLTAEGAAAFNGEYGSYAAGDALDPITLAVTTSGCTLGAKEAAAPTATTGADESAAGSETDTGATAQAQPRAQEIPWIPIAIGGVALLVIGVTAGMLVAGRKRPAAAAQTTQSAPEPPASDPGQPNQHGQLGE